MLDLLAEISWWSAAGRSLNILVIKWAKLAPPSTGADHNPWSLAQAGA
jgi:hypothetical protein